MKKHNSGSLETVNMIKQVLSFAAKRRKASIMKALERHRTALQHQPTVLRRNSPLPVVNGSLKEMATPVAHRKAITSLVILKTICDIDRFMVKPNGVFV